MFNVMSRHKPKVVDVSVMSKSMPVCRKPVPVYKVRGRFKMTVIWQLMIVSSGSRTSCSLVRFVNACQQIR